MVHFCKWKLPFYTENFLPQMMLWFYDLQVSILWGKSQYIVTIFLQSDPVTIQIIFTVPFSVATNRGQLLFLGSVYFTVYSWIRYMWAIELGLIDISSSTCSLSAPLSAVNTSLRKRTALEIAQWVPAGMITTRVYAPLVQAAATIRGRRLFR